MCHARPSLTDVVLRTPSTAALKVGVAAADEIVVDRYAHTSDAARGGRA